jgi:hypothetical protein
MHDNLEVDFPRGWANYSQGNIPFATYIRTVEVLDMWLMGGIWGMHNQNIVEIAVHFTYLQVFERKVLPVLFLQLFGLWEETNC